MHIISKLYNLPIIILVKTDKINTLCYKRIMCFNYNNKESFYIDEFVKLLYENENHYQLLETNKLL